MIYTGYFSKVKRYKDLGLVPISIAQYAPGFYEGYALRAFAPHSWLVSSYKSGRATEIEFQTKYLDYLNSSEEVAQAVEDLVATAKDEEGDLILLCYETPEKFCHRHILANWLGEKGIEVKEYILDNQEK